MINSVKYSVKCWSLNKENREGKKEEGSHGNLEAGFFFHFCCFYLTGQFMHDLILPVDMVSFPLSCDSLEYQTLGSPFFYPFFPLSSQSFILFSLCRISSVISHLLSFVWFHPPTMGVKITFQLERFMLQSASRCNLFFAEVKTSGCICCTSRM